MKGKGCLVGMEESMMICQVIVTQEEDWFIAKDITTRIASQGRTITESLASLKEALELYYEDEHDEIRYPAFLTTIEVSV